MNANPDLLRALRVTEDELAGLLEFIDGRGPFGFYGTGIWTYPSSIHEYDARVYRGCLALEAMGLIRRRPMQAPAPGKPAVYFEPIPDPPDANTAGDGQWRAHPDSVLGRARRAIEDAGRPQLPSVVVAVAIAIAALAAVAVWTVWP